MNIPKNFKSYVSHCVKHRKNTQHLKCKDCKFEDFCKFLGQKVVPAGRCKLMTDTLFKKALLILKIEE